jgi:hypothetical protein
MSELQAKIDAILDGAKTESEAEAVFTRLVRNGWLPDTPEGGFHAGAGWARRRNPSTIEKPS